VVQEMPPHLDSKQEFLMCDFSKLILVLWTIDLTLKKISKFYQIICFNNCFYFSKMKEFQRALKSVFESVIMLELYPRSQIDLQVFVLESDGSYKSAAFNAVSLAIMNAGIAMKDFLVATNSGLLN
jgi:hypothetical protein